jgi:hypothetical protein
MAGLDFYLDPSAVDAGTAVQIRMLLMHAIVALDKRVPRPGSAAG